MSNKINQKPTNSSGIPTHFEWKAEPLIWAGYDRRDLYNLVERTADFFKIPTEKRHMIQIHCHDYEFFTYKGGRENGKFAIITQRKYKSNWYDSRNPVFRLDIRLNRSLEGFYDYVRRKKPDYGISGVDYDHVISDKLIVSTLREPWEGLAWLVSEELSHAAYELDYENRFEQKRDECIHYLKSAIIHRAFRDWYHYTYNLKELMASRGALKFLEEMSSEKSPDRAPFFKSMHDLSIEKKMTVIPNFELIYSDLFVSTGNQ